jgi:hypothetical protein
MRDDIALSERFRRQAGWWRMAPFVTVLIVLLITAFLGNMNSAPQKTSGVVAEAQDRTSAQEQRR